MYIKLNENKSQLNNDVSFYLKSIDPRKIPTIPEIKKQLYAEYAKTDEVNKQVVSIKDTSSEDKNKKLGSVESVKKEEIIKTESKVEEKVVNEKKEVNSKVKLDLYDENGWAYYKKEIEEVEETSEETEENYDDTFDDWDFDEEEEVEESKEVEEVIEDSEEDDEEFEDWNFDEDEDDDDGWGVVENTKEVDVKEEETYINKKGEIVEDDDDSVDFPEMIDEDEEEIEEDDEEEFDDFPELDDEEDEDEEIVEEDDEEEFDDFPELDDEEDEDVEENSKEVIKEEKLHEKDKSDGEVSKKGTFGKSKDDAWRKNSKVGDVENLWDFSNMKPLSEKECRIFLDSIGDIREKLNNTEVFEELKKRDTGSTQKSREDKQKELLKKRFEERRARLKKKSLEEEQKEDDIDVTGELEDPDEFVETGELVEDNSIEDGSDIFESLVEEKEEPKEVRSKVDKKKAKDIDDDVFDTLTGQKDRVAETTKRDVENRNTVLDVSDFNSVRDFVKKNPGCGIEEVLKYFSKKEVDRDIKLGRVLQKNKKLFV